MASNAVSVQVDIPDEHLAPYPGVAPSQFPDIKEKTVIVTGGGHGIGKSITRAFAQAGAKHIFILARDTSRANEAARELAIEQPETTFSAHSVDVAVPATVHAFFASLKTPADILANNAGYLAKPTNFVDADLGDWWKAFEVNVLGPATVTQAYLRHRREHHGTGVGVVVNVNTMGAYNIRIPSFTSYSATKAATLRYQELLAVDVDPSEARFHSMHPGSVRTDMHAKSGLEGMIPETDVRLPGQFAVFLASDRAAFLNGRMAHAGWDVDKLLANKEAIVGRDLFRTQIGR